MIRFIFYLAFAYIIMKVLRLFIDPLFERPKGNSRVNTPNSTSGKTASHPPLGDYVDFEEVK
ncbi:MAG TPA: hypothetical protein PLP34_05515 [Chitinophagaceae bacterium]|nr:hypothetical protein [Chitinophagaceae bacterium]